MGWLNINGNWIGRHSGKSWRSYWKTQSTFWSDGIIEDGKLKNVIGGSTLEPSLVDSYCLTMAVDDTIVFTSLAGWSIVSHLGTSTVIIDGNNIKCTGNGTLYNLILSDGNNIHIYPLAEGGYTKAFDTFSNPVNGTIVCASLTWSVQSEYHKNVEGYNSRNDIDFFTQSSFLGSGIPTGWANNFSVAVITTTNNVVRVSTGLGVDLYYKFCINKNGLLTVGKSYVTKIRIRASNSLVVQIRYGGNTISSVVATTEWQTLTTVASACISNEHLGITGVATEAGVWFEFDYILIKEVVESTYCVPKRSTSDLDAEGNAIAILGNGYFISCETKLLFPDVLKYQEVDEKMLFFYTRKGVQNKYSYNDLYDNPYGFDRVFITKTENRLTRLIVVNQKDFTRSQFIAYLAELGKPSYIYKKIENGAFVWFSLWTGTARSAWQKLITEKLNARGIKQIGVSGYSWDDNAAEAWIALENKKGNTIYAQRLESYGATSWVLADGEETEFADEIASGDVIVFDTYDGKRGAYVKIDWPDFTMVGTLVQTTKQNGTVILDAAGVYGYDNVIWIPAGQSGVPAALSEVPLSSVMETTVDKRLRFRSWAADDHYGVSFTNADQINVYVISGEFYKHLVSDVGMKCYLLACQNRTDAINIGLRQRGWLEGHPGELVNALVMSKAIDDSGMIYGSSGGWLGYYANTIFDNQNNPRLWCACFGHTLWNTDTLTNILNTRLPLMSSKNQIYEGDMIGWSVDTEAKFDQFIAKCDELGILILSPDDFIKNMRFNDYNINDFWLA